MSTASKFRDQPAYASNVTGHERALDQLRHTLFFGAGAQLRNGFRCIGLIDKMNFVGAKIIKGPTSWIYDPVLPGSTVHDMRIIKVVKTIALSIARVRQIKPLLATALLFPAFAVSLMAKDIPVADARAFPEALAAAQPGDCLILAEGEWRDASLVFTGKGTEDAPITLRAATPGKTVLTGKSTLRIGGEYLVVEGLLFQNPDPSVSDLIEFRQNSKKLARHCRLTGCAIIDTVMADRAVESRWVNLYGADHRVDRCSFAGKSSKGATFVVWLGGGSKGRHRIDHNYFGPREELGSNGGETIRIGDSATSMLTAACLVERNLFERCNGEAECISNKSCGNIYRDNTFLEVSGTLTLRHGNGCLVERNAFLGNGARGTGGVRIIGEDHTVRGNYFEKLTGVNARAAISIMLGIPDSPAHRYFQVKRARVENNTFVDCKTPILLGLNDDKKATLAPIETNFNGNQIVSPRHAMIEARCPLDGVVWTDNLCSGPTLGITPVAGIALGEPTVTPLQPITRAEVGTPW